MTTHEFAEKQMLTFAQQEVARLRPKLDALQLRYQELAIRIRDAVAYASDNIGGGEEDRHFDSTLSSIIGILEGELNSDGVPR